MSARACALVVHTGILSVLLLFISRPASSFFANPMKVSRALGFCRVSLFTRFRQLGEKKLSCVYLLLSSLTVVTSERIVFSFAFLTFSTLLVYFLLTFLLNALR